MINPQVRWAVALAGSIAVSAASTPATLGAQGSMSPPPAAPARQMSAHSGADSAQSLINFITTVSRDEVAAAELAASKSSRADVKAYAAQALDDHKNVLAAWAQKVPSLSLTMPDSTGKSTSSAPTGAAMKNGISEVRDTVTITRGGVGAAAIHSANVASLAKLQALGGAEFDKLFVDSELEGHEAVMKELERYPVTYTDLQTLLTQFKDMVLKHRNTLRKLSGAA